jgi:3-hydroxyisobutyrate dehydrogenase
MTPEETVAVLGAGGTMGLAMARNIARAGMAVRAWDRTREKARPLEDDGAEVFDTPREAAAGATVILTMLVDADAVLDTMEAALAGGHEDVVWLQMSTIGESGTDRCAELARAHGLTLIDAPVQGTKQPAEEGKLVILASGPDGANKRVRPIFDAVGHKTIWAGEAGAGTRLKIVTNAWLLAIVEGGAEAIALAEGLDLDPRLLFDAIDGGPLDVAYLRMKGTAMLEGNFDPSFKLKLAAKDARLIEEASQRHGLDVPLFSVIRRRLAEGAAEHGDEDVSATYLTSSPKARSA